MQSFCRIVSRKKVNRIVHICKIAQLHLYTVGLLGGTLTQMPEMSKLTWHLSLSYSLLPLLQWTTIFCI